MSQSVTKKRSAPKPTPRRRARSAQILEEERLLEARARLQIEADEARRKFVREMVKMGASIFVVLTACAVSAFLICSTQDPGAREAGIAILGGLTGYAGNAAYRAHASRLKG
jgi:hypothetical protein